jgi:hypothetical protein
MLDAAMRYNETPVPQECLIGHSRVVVWQAGRIPEARIPGNQLSSHTVSNMANIGMKNCVYLARFRCQGKEYKKSLKTTNPEHARAALRRVEDTLHWLAIGHLTVPDGVDPGDFVVSGGNLPVHAQKQKPRHVPTVAEAVEEYTNNLGTSRR